MATSEMVRQGVEVFKRPTTVSIKDEGEGWGPVLVGQQGGQEIGVMADGKVVWRREVFPVFAGLRRVFLIDVPKPLYAQRVARAEREARRIASRLS